MFRSLFSWITPFGNGNHMLNLVHLEFRSLFSCITPFGGADTMSLMTEETRLFRSLFSWITPFGALPRRPLQPHHRRPPLVHRAGQPAQPLQALVQPVLRGPECGRFAG